MSDKVKDETERVITDKASDDKGASESAKDTAIDSKVQAKIDAFDSILDKHGYDSVEDMVADLEKGQELKDLIGSRDAKKILKEHAETKKWKEDVEKYWAEQEKQANLEGEEPEDTAKRLRKEKKELEQKLKDRDNEDKQKADEKEKEKNAEKSIKAFNKTVKSVIDDTTDIPKEYKPFLREFSGVDNPANDVDPNSKVDVKEMTKAQIKKFQSFEQVVIKRYIDGKSQLADITPDSASDTPVKDKKKIMNLKEARAAFREKFGV